MKYLFLCIFLFPFLCYADSNRDHKGFFNKCMNNSANVKNLKVLNVMNSDFVDQMEDVMSFTLYKESYGMGQLNIDIENNIHDGKNNYNYVFTDGSDGAVFVLGESKEAGNKILVCAVVETKKINLNPLYIGQDFKYFKDRFEVVNEVDVLIIERGDTLIALYFKNHKLSKVHFLSEGYDG